MSRLASWKTAQIWAERFAWGERSNVPVAQAYPGRRFALPWAISFCPFGADGSIPAPPGFPWTSPGSLRGISFPLDSFDALHSHFGSSTIFGQADIQDSTSNDFPTT